MCDHEGLHEAHEDAHWTPPPATVALSALPSLSAVVTVINGLEELAKVAEALDPSEKTLIGEAVSLLNILKSALSAV
jgi:hypothetical protein